MENRYILYVDGKISETTSPNLEGIKKLIKMFLKAGILAKQHELYEVLDTQTGNIVYTRTRKEWKESNFKEENNEEFTDEQLKAIKSLERAFKKCKGVDLVFRSEDDTLTAFKRGSYIEALSVDVDTSQTLKF